MKRRFFTLDVFTDRVLAGNPLAVVLDGSGLERSRMQAIAREFNLSETTFVLEPRDPVNTARLRIFTPGRERSHSCRALCEKGVLGPLGIAFLRPETCHLLLRWRFQSQLLHDHLQVFPGLFFLAGITQEEGRMVRDGQFGS